MDELTTKLLEEEKEMVEHPERYTFVEVCDKCGSRTERQAPKAEIEKGRQRHPEYDGQLLECHVGLCEPCGEKEPKDEE